MTPQIITAINNNACEAVLYNEGQEVRAALVCVDGQTAPDLLARVKTVATTSVRRAP